MDYNTDTTNSNHRNGSGHDPVALVLSKLEKVKRVSGGYMARCPSHDDRRASLSIRRGADGRVLLHCHAGCSFEQNIAALDIDVADTFASGSLNAEKPSIVATYSYCDEAGKPLYQKVRFYPKDFRQRRTDGQGGWAYALSAGWYEFKDWGIKAGWYKVKNLNGSYAEDPDQKPHAGARWFGKARRVLLGLDEIKKLPPGSMVFIVESEKTVDRLKREGLNVTTSGGANSWRDGFSENLRGFDLVILPDNDRGGRDYARAVALSCFGEASRIRILELDGLKEKQDPYDWFEAGGTSDGLLSLVGATPDYDPASFAFRHQKRSIRAALKPDTVPISDNIERDASEITDALNFIFARANCPDKVVRYLMAVIGAVQEKTDPGKELEKFEANDFEIGLRMRGEDETEQDKERAIREGAKIEGLPREKYRPVYEARKIERIKKTAQRGRAACDEWQRANGYEFVISFPGGQRDGENFSTIYQAPILAAAADVVRTARLRRSYPKDSTNAIRLESKKALARLEATPLKRERFNRRSRKPADIRAANHRAILTALEKNIELTTRMGEDQDPAEYIETFFSDAKELFERLGFTVEYEKVLVHRHEEKNMDKPLDVEPDPVAVKKWNRLCDEMEGSKSAKSGWTKVSTPPNGANHQQQQQVTRNSSGNDLHEAKTEVIETQQLDEISHATIFQKENPENARKSPALRQVNTGQNTGPPSATVAGAPPVPCPECSHPTEVGYTDCCKACGYLFTRHYWRANYPQPPPVRAKEAPL